MIILVGLVVLVMLPLCWMATDVVRLELPKLSPSPTSVTVRLNLVAGPPALDLDLVSEELQAAASLDGIRFELKWIAAPADLNASNTTKVLSLLQTEWPADGADLTMLLLSSTMARAGQIVDDVQMKGRHGLLVRRGHGIGAVAAAAVVRIALLPGNTGAFAAVSSYQLMLTLVDANPSDNVVSWDPARGIKMYLDPLLSSLNDVLEVDILSQVGRCLPGSSVSCLHTAV